MLGKGTEICLSLAGWYLKVTVTFKTDENDKPSETRLRTKTPEQDGTFP